MDQVTRQHDALLEMLLVLVNILKAPGNTDNSAVFRDNAEYQSRFIKWPGWKVEPRDSFLYLIIRVWSVDNDSASVFYIEADLIGVIVRQLLATPDDDDGNADDNHEHDYSAACEVIDMLLPAASELKQKQKQAEEELEEGELDTDDDTDWETGGGPTILHQPRLTNLHPQSNNFYPSTPHKPNKQFIVMSSSEGRESPSPESQTGAQLKDTPASGQGVNEAPNKANDLQDQLKNLSSNPKGPMDDSLEEKFSKTQNSSTDKKS